MSAPDGIPGAADASYGEHRVVRTVLRAGLGVSSALLVAGLVVIAITGQGRAPAVPLLHIFAEHDSGVLLAALGVLVLALTPMVRVVALVVLWSRERDWKFVAVAVAVVLVLAAAVMLGGG